MPRKVRKRRPRGVVDTSVLVAGISGFRKPYVRGKNSSADLLHRWTNKSDFLWLVTEDILDEYTEVLKRLGAWAGEILVHDNEHSEKYLPDPDFVKLVSGD